MKAIGFLFLFSILIFCEGKTVFDEQNDTKIRVMNNSGQELKSLSLFSMKFDDLSPMETSAYQLLEFDESIDDPMIYCAVDLNILSLFLEIPKNGGNYTYSIDSLDLIKKRIYLNLLLDK